MTRKKGFENSTLTWYTEAKRKTSKCVLEQGPREIVKGQKFHGATRDRTL